MTQVSSIEYLCTTTLDWNSSNNQWIVLANGAQTFTFAAPPASGPFFLRLKQPASGAAGTVTWPATILWTAGVAPTLTVTNGKVDIIQFYYSTVDVKYHDIMVSLNH